jgi:hypothetical protein
MSARVLIRLTDIAYIRHLICTADDLKKQYVHVPYGELDLNGPEGVMKLKVANAVLKRWTDQAAIDTILEFDPDIKNKWWESQVRFSD